MGAVKAIRRAGTLWVAEIESTRAKRVSPDGEPGHQIGRGFHDYQMPRWSREVEGEFADGEVRVENLRRRVSFADGIEVKIGHIEVTRVIHRHVVRICQPRGVVGSVGAAR